MIRLATVLALTASISATCASAEQNGPPMSATGVLLSFKEHIIEMLVDGKTAKTRYQIYLGESPGSLVPGKNVFPDNRITVSLDIVHGPPTCINITKEATIADGSVTGKVLYTDGYSLVVQPKEGAADGFGQPAPVTPEMAAQIQAVKIGDIVTIAFNSDSERHRIKALTVVAKASVSKDDGAKTGANK